MSEHNDSIDPPNSFTVHDHRPRVYDAYGRPYVRQTGFVARNVQTTGTFPALTRRPPRKGGKKGR